MTLRAFFATIWRRRWLALGVLVVELAALALYLATAPRSYTSDTTITATPQQSLLQSTGNFDTLETTLAQIVNSRAVVRDVQSHLSVKRSVDQLQQEITGTQVTGTVLIRISVTDSDPRVAKEIANLVTDVLPLHDPSDGLFVFTQTDPASTPQGYSSPDVSISLLAGVLLGLLLACVAALARESVARTINDAEALAAAGDTDVLGVVPYGERDMALVDPGSPGALALRSLRVALEFASSKRGDSGPIVITSADPDPQAATWLTANLAVALAQVEHQVLVIDADFSHPTDDPLLADTSGTGLFDVLRAPDQEQALRDALRVGPIDGVTVLPAGDPGGTSTASLVELHFTKIVALLGDRFDAIIVRAASAAESDDAAIMAIGGSLLLSVSAERVRVRSLTTLAKKMRDLRVDVIGSVLLTAGRRRRA